MRINGTHTLVQDGKAYNIPCFWQSSEGFKVSKQSADNTNTAVVFIPITEQKPSKGDYMVKNHTTETDIAKLLNMGALKVMTIDVMDFGSTHMQHYEVGLK